MNASSSHRSCRRFALALAAGALLAGCGTGVDRAPGERDVSIGVTSTRTAQALDGPGPGTALDGAEAFLVRNGVGPADRVYVTGRPAVEREAVARALAAPGRSVEAVAGDGALRLLLVRAVAIPPTCGDWSDSPRQDFSNLPPRNYGCATQSNLARMVADPNDLVSGQAGGPADSEAGTLAVRAYRLGEIEFETVDFESATTGGG